MVARQNGPSWMSTRNRVAPKHTYSYPKLVDTFRSYQDTSFINKAHRGEMLQKKVDEQLRLSNIIGNANAERVRNDYLGIAAPIPESYNKFDSYEDMTTKMTFAKNILHKFMNTKEAVLTLRWLQDRNLIDTFLKFGDAFAKSSPKGITAKEFEILWNTVDTNLAHVMNPTRASTVRTIAAVDASPVAMATATVPEYAPTRASIVRTISAVDASPVSTATATIPEYAPPPRVLITKSEGGTQPIGYRKTFDPNELKQKIAESVKRRTPPGSSAPSSILPEVLEEKAAAITGDIVKQEQPEVSAPDPAYTAQLVGKKGPASVATTAQETLAGFSASSGGNDEQDLTGTRKSTALAATTYFQRIVDYKANKAEQNRLLNLPENQNAEAINEIKTEKSRLKSEYTNAYNSLKTTHKYADREAVDDAIKLWEGDKMKSKSAK